MGAYEGIRKKFLLVFHLLLPLPQDFELPLLPDGSRPRLRFSMMMMVASVMNMILIVVMSEIC